MTMPPRLYIDVPLRNAQIVPLDAAHRHYLRNVMRMGQGDGIILFNGADGAWAAVITEIGKARVEARLVRQIQAQSDEGGICDIVLLIAPVKKMRLDYLAQKATEMGVSRIVPVLTARAQGGHLNLARLRANAIEAAEQSGRLSVPAIESSVRLGDILQNWHEAYPSRALIFCDETAEQSADIATLRSKKLAILIGPEGGFTSKERASLYCHNFVYCLTLGRRILRSDTAVVAALALVQAACGDW